MGLWVERANHQAQAVNSLIGANARVMYDYQASSAADFDLSTSSPLPASLIESVGIDFFHSVAWVDLDSPAITDETLEILQFLPELKVLHISNCSLTDAGFVSLSKLEELEWLTLNTGTLSDAALTHVGQLTSLRTLEISNVPITDAGLRHLYSLQNLERLVLENTRVTGDGADRLAQVLDDCEVEY